MTDQTNTPELRFPEFNTDWTTNQAKNLFTNVSDKKHDGDLLVLSATQDKGMVPRQALDLEIKYDKKNLSNYKRTLPNDFIISLRSFQGGFELNTIEGIVSPAYTVLRGEEGLAQPKFFKQYFKSIRFIKKLDSMIYGIRDGKSISYKEFSTFSINYPSILEQQKIGDFFSKLDRQIELEEEKLELLEQQKKGYMQKIFSQELRFKDENGKDYPAWEIKKLRDLYKYQQGQQIPVENQYKIPTNNMKRFIRIVDITENPKKRYIKDRKESGLINRKDLIMIRYGASAGTISMGYEGVIANNLFKFVKKQNVDNRYFYFLLKKSHFKIKSLSSQSAMPALNFNAMDTLKFSIPQYSEQQKIGDFFSELDKLVEKQVSKIELLKQRKQGLLQKMFI
ncbi:restriction endonuclease subunit S [Staphylococcus hominis subsp. novobiosepticus]